MQNAKINRPTRGQIDQMVSALVRQLDDDLHKSFFDWDCIEDEELAVAMRAKLRSIVKKHLGMHKE